MITAWPRLEIGNSSVTPWIRPKMMAWKYVIMRSPLCLGYVYSAGELDFTDALHILSGDREVRDQREDRDPEHRAHGSVPEPEAAERLGSGEQVRERGAERPGHDVGEPECEHAVQSEPPIADRRNGEQGREQQSRHEEPEVQAERGHVPGRRS